MQDGIILAFAFTCLILVLYTWNMKESFSQPLIRIEGSYNNYVIQVRVRERNDKFVAANKLAKLAYNLNKLVRACEMDKKFDNGKVGFMKQNWNPNNIEESDPDSNTTSFSLNKGKKLVFCIRHKDDEGTFVDDNTILFVGIHELAHLMTTEVGHTPLFWKNMKILLEKAVDIGIYSPENYEAAPKKYCGIEITSTPLSDYSL